MKLPKVVYIFLVIFYLSSCDYEGSHLPENLRLPVSSPSPALKFRRQLLQLLPKGGVVIEIGVETGNFSDAIYTITKPSKLYLLDCWQAISETENRPQNMQDRYYHIVQQKFGNKKDVEIIKEYSVQAAALFEDDYFDWIYIDACHTYDSAKSDLEAWFPKVKNGGFIAGHDYVVRPNFGVVSAVNEFVQKHGLAIVYLTNKRNPSYAIKIIK